MEMEISKSVKLLSEKYKITPIGYRFPDGDIHSSDYLSLRNNKILYYASIFPSWRPGRFNNSKI